MLELLLRARTVLLLLLLLVLGLDGREDPPGVKGRGISLGPGDIEREPPGGAGNF